MGCQEFLPPTAFRQPASVLCRGCQTKFEKQRSKGRGNPALSNFTSAELMQELRNRGYSGELIASSSITKIKV